MASPFLGFLVYMFENFCVSKFGTMHASSVSIVNRQSKPLARRSQIVNQFIGVTPSYVTPVAGVPLASVAVPCCSMSEGTHSVLKSSVELLVSLSTLRPSDVSDSILRRTLLK